MIRRNISMILVCLAVFVGIAPAETNAWHYSLAAADPQQIIAANPQNQPDVTTKASQALRPKAISKVKPDQKITKCKPLPVHGVKAVPYGPLPPCILPIARPYGWDMNATLIYARTKGKVQYGQGVYGSQWFFGYTDEIDLNKDLNLPEHGYIPEFTAAYHFKPNWSVRYSVMPMAMEGSGTPQRSFVFGTHTYNVAQNTRSKWERVVQTAGLMYDPVRTYTSRVSVFADYVRVDDKLTFMSPNCCSDTMNTDLNMAMAGIEFERCLKTGRICNTLSLECRAGLAFGDDAVGADLMTGLKYSIPLNNGRWGYVKGGYRFISFKKKFSEVRMTDTTMEGATVQMGLVF